MIESELTSHTIALPVEHQLHYLHAVRPLKTIACLLISDAFAVVLSLTAAALLRDLWMHSTSKPILSTIILSAVFVLCSLMAGGMYPGVGVNPVEEVRKTSICITLAFLSLWAATFLRHDLTESRLVYLGAYACAILGVPILRGLTRSTLSRKAWWGSNAAILGFGQTGQMMFEKLKSNPWIGLKPVAVLDDDESSLTSLGSRLATGPLERCLEITREHRISYGIVCMSELTRTELLDILDRYGKCFSHLMVIPDLIGMTSLGVSAREFGGIVGLELTQQLLRPIPRFIKRLMDLAITAALTPIAIPVIVLSALLVKLEDGGPMFYSDERVGRGGEIFSALKLRTMVLDSPAALSRYLNANPSERETWDACQKLKRDPRITRIGRILRKTSLDELPQLWNVLIGDMSIVGPRPMQRSQVMRYGTSYSLYTQVRPGITGLWQVSGRNHLTFADRVRLDKYVIQNWSVWLDLYILVRTVGVVLTAHGAY